MFGSEKKGAPVDYSKIETVIGEGTSVRGDIESAGTIRIDGRLEGNINHQGTLIVGPKGYVNANVHSALMAVAGEVTGDLVIDDKLELLATARLTGNIQCGHLVVQEGARFEGQSNMLGSQTSGGGVTDLAAGKQRLQARAVGEKS